MDPENTEVSSASSFGNVGLQQPAGEIQVESPQHTSQPAQSVLPEAAKESAEEQEAKKPRLESNGMETSDASQTVQSLNNISPYVIVERDYKGTPKDGSVKGEIEWAIWDSDMMIRDENGCFIYDYSEHHEEHALVLEGKATIVPRNLGDSSDPISVSKGDYLAFKRGFQCEWRIHERVRKRYCFFNEKGDIVVGGERISCDVCGKDCTDESAVVHKGDDAENVEDLCLPCYRIYKGVYATDGEHLVNGVNVGDLTTIPLTDTKRKRPDF
jgi:uncharacterized cupin superfamily protein